MKTSVFWHFFNILDFSRNFKYFFGRKISLWQATTAMTCDDMPCHIILGSTAMATMTKRLLYLLVGPFACFICFLNATSAAMFLFFIFCCIGWVVQYCGSNIGFQDWPLSSLGSEMPLLLGYSVVCRHVIVKDSMTYTFIHGRMHAFD